jgi:hypothetical protein
VCTAVLLCAILYQQKRKKQAHKDVIFHLTAILPYYVLSAAENSITNFKQKEKRSSGILKANLLDYEFLLIFVFFSEIYFAAIV